MGTHGTDLGFYGYGMDKIVFLHVFGGFQAFCIYRGIRGNVLKRHSWPHQIPLTPIISHGTPLIGTNSVSRGAYPIQTATGHMTAHLGF